MQTFLLDSLNSVQKNALIRRNDPFFFSFGSSFLFSQLTPFLRVFFAKFGTARSEVVFLNVTNLGHLESLTLIVLNFLKVCTFNFLPSSKI